MTFAELDPALRGKVEQVGMDAGSMWSEQFREERGRDPEPEECDEQAERMSERLTRRARKIMGAHGVEADEAVLDEIRTLLAEKFVEFSLDT
jgi:ATP:corrinoid adenosyltransferase